MDQQNISFDQKSKQEAIKQTLIKQKERVVFLHRLGNTVVTVLVIAIFLIFICAVSFYHKNNYVDLLSPHPVALENRDNSSLSQNISLTTGVELVRTTGREMDPISLTTSPKPVLDLTTHQFFEPEKCENLVSCLNQCESSGSMCQTFCDQDSKKCKQECGDENSYCTSLCKDLHGSCHIECDRDLFDCQIKCDKIC